MGPVTYKSAFDFATLRVIYRKPEVQSFGPARSASNVDTRSLHSKVLTQSVALAKPGITRYECSSSPRSHRKRVPSILAPWHQPECFPKICKTTRFLEPRNASIKHGLPSPTPKTKTSTLLAWFIGLPLTPWGASIRGSCPRLEVLRSPKG